MKLTLPRTAAGALTEVERAELRGACRGAWLAARSRAKDGVIAGVEILVPRCGVEQLQWLSAELERGPRMEDAQVDVGGRGADALVFIEQRDLSGAWEDKPRRADVPKPRWVR